MLEAATPDAFAGRRVIVQGSPEETAYFARLEEERRRRDEREAAKVLPPAIGSPPAVVSGPIQLPADI